MKMLRFNRRDFLQYCALLSSGLLAPRGLRAAASASVPHMNWTPAPGSSTIRFEDITAKSGLDFTTNSCMTPNKNQPETMVGGVGMIDYDNDGYMDLFFVNGADLPSLKKNDPKYYNRLFHNNRDGTFTDVSEKTGISKVLGKGMGVGLNDYDGDGFIDIFVANDNMPNSLFHNLKGKSFEEVALDVGVAYAETGKAVSGMGAEFRDLDNDGLPDIWHTATELETFPLFRNIGNGMFVDVTGKSGLARYTLEMSGWGNGVGDFDNDGLKDLIVGRGNVLDNISDFSERTFGEPLSIFRNIGGMKFEEVSTEKDAANQVRLPYRGVVIGDLFNSGHLDVVTSALNSKARVLRNTSTDSNNWIKFQLVGTKSNKMGIGAQLKLTTDDGSTQYDVVSTSAGYQASRDPRAHFGLGPFTTAKQLEIKWPSGIHQVVNNLAANKIHKIEEA